MKAHMVLCKKKASQSRLIQLRWEGGHSKTFSALQLGGEDRAREVALNHARHLGLTVNPRKRKGSSGFAGIRFRWQTNKMGDATPYVVVTWVNTNGKPCCTQFSVEKNGVQPAIALAARKRRECAGVYVDEAVLMENYQRFQKAGPF